MKLAAILSIAFATLVTSDAWPEGSIGFAHEDDSANSPVLWLYDSSWPDKGCLHSTAGVVVQDLNSEYRCRYYTYVPLFLRLIYDILWTWRETDWCRLAAAIARRG
jgi:hypothetical protein